MRKDAFLYEYMNDWEKVNETSLPEKENFYSHLDVENTTDADYTHGKRIWEDFKINIHTNIMIFMFKAIHYC